MINTRNVKGEFESFRELPSKRKTGINNQNSLLNCVWRSNFSKGLITNSFWEWKTEVILRTPAKKLVYVQRNSPLNCSLPICHLAWAKRLPLKVLYIDCHMTWCHHKIHRRLHLVHMADLKANVYQWIQLSDTGQQSSSLKLVVLTLVQIHRWIVLSTWLRQSMCIGFDRSVRSAPEP